jgi:serine/threonine-protein kinase TTK/MPS1
MNFGMYQVTDKKLLKEGCVSPRDGRINDDQYIYMVLEFGEIDLAHMVAQKWKERNSTTMKIDENWLRFYWQVNFILFILR